MSKISKILYIITQSELGGAQKYVQDLASFVKEKNLQVIVAAGEKGSLLDKLQALNINTYILKHLKREINFFHDIAGIWEIYSLIKNIKPDIVHLNSSKAGVLGAFAAKLAGVKKIMYTVHGFVFLEPLPRWKKIFYIFIEKISGYYKDIIICVSDNDLKQGLAHHIAPEKKFHTIHNGIDFGKMTFFEKQDARKKILEIIPSKKQVLENADAWIGTIANFYPAKGLDILMQSSKEIIANHPKTIFIVFGDGDERKNLEILIEKYKLSENFILAGRIPQAQQYLKAFDCYVSSSRKEGFPYALLEAMAAGLPIIATEVGGVPEMLGDAGILIPPESPAHLSQAIGKALQEKDLLQTLSQKASNRAQKKFSLGQMLQKTYELYE